jgi:transcriptional regulator with XRE-family HTH domain
MESTMDQLRTAIRASKKSRYRLAKDTGMDAAHLVRVMQGTRRVSLVNLEKLCAALGLEVVLRPVASKGKDVTK